MTTATIVETTKINKADRYISKQYTDGNYRVTVRTSYYASAKAYFSSVTESRLEFRGDYTVEISQLNIGLGEQRPEDDYHQKIQTVKVDRYNFKDLEKYHALAVAEANDSLIITELLIKGKTNSEIHGKGN
jgi:hypothetical protein